VQCFNLSFFVQRPAGNFLRARRDSSEIIEKIFPVLGAILIYTKFFVVTERFGELPSAKSSLQYFNHGRRPYDESAPTDQRSHRFT
jgi:hypothetical protein